MSEEREITGHCGWAALGLVVVLFAGILTDSPAGGLTGLRTAEFPGVDHASELVGRLFFLAGIIA